MGHAGYESSKVEPAFWLGEGLGGYASFTSSIAGADGSITKDGGVLSVRAKVKNTSERAGKEVVQLYVRPPAEHIKGTDRPIRSVSHCGCSSFFLICANSNAPHSSSPSPPFVCPLARRRKSRCASSRRQSRTGRAERTDTGKSALASGKSSWLAVPTQLLRSTVFARPSRRTGPGAASVTLRDRLACRYASMLHLVNEIYRVTPQ